MDSRLKERLSKIHKQIDALFEMEKLAGELEATEKTLFAQLFLKTDSQSSVEVRKNTVYASKDWRDFTKGLILAQAQRNKERRVLELMERAFQVEYAEFKIEHETLKKPS